MKNARTIASSICISLILLMAAGCAPSAPTPSAAPPVIEINVSAAMGLKEALLDIQKDYEAKRPNIKIVYNLGASGALQAQIEQGAPADVFISAAEKQLDELQKKNM